MEKPKKRKSKKVEVEEEDEYIDIELTLPAYISTNPNNMITGVFPVLDNEGMLKEDMCEVERGALAPVTLLGSVAQWGEELIEKNERSNGSIGGFGR